MFMFMFIEKFLLGSLPVAVSTLLTLPLEAKLASLSTPHQYAFLSCDASAACPF